MPHILYLPLTTAALKLVMTDTKYKVVEIAGKGRGVVATTDITIGTRIIAEDPILLLGAGGFMSVVDIAARLMRDLKAMTPENQRIFLGLSNCYPDESNKFMGIFKTNALPCGPFSPVGGIYPTVCRVSHSCRPNAFSSWHDDLKQETIHAFCDIKEGEEITIAYLPSSFMTPRDARRADLKKHFNFDCECEACSLSPENIAASDARRAKIREFDTFMNHPRKLMATAPADLTRRCDAVQTVMAEEFGSEYSPVAMQAYQDIVQALAAHGSVSHMTSYGMYAHHAAGILQGYDHPNAKRNKAAVMDPMSHKNFGDYD